MDFVRQIGFEEAKYRERAAGFADLAESADFAEENDCICLADFAEAIDCIGLAESTDFADATSLNRAVKAVYQLSSTRRPIRANPESSDVYQVSAGPFKQVCKLSLTS